MVWFFVVALDVEAMTCPYTDCKVWDCGEWPGGPECLDYLPYDYDPKEEYKCERADLKREGK